MSWVRAVWKENEEEVEGVVPALWCQDSVLRWPLKNPLATAKGHAPPLDDWLSFDLIKKKFSSDSRKDCDDYSQTTSTELEDAFPETLCKKRLKKKRADEEFVTHFSEEEIEAVEDGGNVQGHGITPYPSAPTMPARNRTISSEGNTVAELNSDPPAKRSKSISSTASGTSEKSKASARTSNDTPAKATSGKSHSKTLARTSNCKVTPAKSSSGKSHSISSASTGKVTPAKHHGSGSTAKPPTLASPVASSTTMPPTLASPVAFTGSPGAQSAPTPTSAIAVSGIEKRLLYELAKLTSVVSSLKSEVKEMRAEMKGALSGPVIQNSGITVPELENGPIKTCQSLKTFLERCNDKEVQVFLLNLLRRIGGSGPKETTRNLLNRLFSNYAMSFISLEGRSVGKYAIKSQPICTVIVEAVLYQHAEATVNMVHKVMADHFKQAPHRSGGAGKGCHLIANDDEDEDELTEAVNSDVIQQDSNEDSSD